MYLFAAGWSSISGILGREVSPTPMKRGSPNWFEKYQAVSRVGMHSFRQLTTTVVWSAISTVTGFRNQLSQSRNSWWFKRKPDLSMC